MGASAAGDGVAAPSDDEILERLNAMCRAEEGASEESEGNTAAIGGASNDGTADEDRPR